MSFKQNLTHSKSKISREFEKKYQTSTNKFCEVMKLIMLVKKKGKSSV